MGKRKSLIPSERIERSIILLRGQKVMLAADLAALYGKAWGQVLNYKVFEDTPVGYLKIFCLSAPSDQMSG